MSRIIEAQMVLAALELPPAQQTEISALTLLVLAQLDENTPWQQAQRRSIGIHGILQEIYLRYDRRYAENTRETVRRQVIHQFEQARIVDRNPDEPSLATNSPRTHYALTDIALRTIRAFNTPNWQASVVAFLEEQQSLTERYSRKREQALIPVTYQGQVYQLSPGEHNHLQVAIIEQFGPRFAPGAELLYMGDTANKSLLVEEDVFAELNIPLTRHDKLPDIVFYHRQRHWLYLIEAVTSHGPVSPKRQIELQALLINCSAYAIFISAFPDFATFRTFLTEIAWETEVWLSELPDHMIHFNGDKFLGPHL